MMVQPLDHEPCFKRDSDEFVSESIFSRTPCPLADDVCARVTTIVTMAVRPLV